MTNTCGTCGQDVPEPAKAPPGSLERHMEWLYGENGVYGNKGPCTCRHTWGSLGVLDRVNMGKGWVRVCTDPACPNHGRRS